MSKKKIFVIGLVVLLGLSFFKKSPAHPPIDTKSQKTETKVQTNASRDVSFTLSHGGIDRIYSVHVPPTTGDAKMPLLVVFHGGVSNIAEIKQTLGWDSTADAHEFLVAYPQGTGDVSFGKLAGMWNSGNCCNPAMKKGIDDIGFVKKMITEIESDFPVDTNRMYLTGISNGSMMAISAACAMSGEIAAFGTVAGSGQYKECSLQKPVPFMYFHGTADKCAPFDGGTTQGCFDLFFKELLNISLKGDEITFASAQQVVNTWKEKNHTSGPEKVIYEQGSAMCTASGYQSPSEVVFCKITGMGHTWPGQLGYGTACDKGPTDAVCKATMKIAGPINHDISANEQLWQFFSRHSLGK